MSNTSRTGCDIVLLTSTYPYSGDVRGSTRQREKDALIGMLTSPISLVVPFAHHSNLAAWAEIPEQESLVMFFSKSPDYS